MSFDPVCWAINGAATTPAVARVLANVASRNAQGINLPGDLKVTQLGTPGGGVQIAPGAAILRNAQAAGESYIGKASSSTTVNIAPTGGSARSDLIVAYVIDPDFAPWTAYTTPTQILNGPYFQPGVLAGVANTTTAASQVVSYSAMALARVDIPSSTGAITNAMITDLRGLAQPRSWNAYNVVPVTGGNDFLTLTDTSWRDWPISNSYSVAVPSWATWAQASVSLVSIQADASGDFASRINLGGLTAVGANFDYNAPAGTPNNWIEGVGFTCYGEFNVTSLQGQTVVLKHQAERINLSNTANLWVTGTPLVQVVYDIRFSERTA